MPRVGQLALESEGCIEGAPNASLLRPPGRLSGIFARSSREDGEGGTLPEPLPLDDHPQLGVYSDYRVTRVH